MMLYASLYSLHKTGADCTGSGCIVDKHSAAGMPSSKMLLMGC